MNTYDYFIFKGILEFVFATKVLIISRFLCALIYEFKL